ncbi:MAG: hypothetical protein GOP50_12225 [Candidatus Heimdallarchaeota archaeon]|nr:hypothetical protein [Candidatus Heimdallarchaeota archaeon]
MKAESEKSFRFILKKIICIEDSSEVTIELINIIEGLEWELTDKDDEVRFVSKNLRSKGSEVNTTSFRKLYSGATRRKLPIVHVFHESEELSGAFQRKAVARVWKLTIREKLLGIRLVPFEDDPYRAKFLELEFPMGIFQIRSILQLFPTDDYFQVNVEHSTKYAKAYKMFKELLPFTVDRIVDLLSTEELAPSFEAWKNDPERYDIPGVDSANITLAKKLASELPAAELDILVKDIRIIMTETDWEELTDKQTIDRYSQFLKYIKKIRKIKRQEPPEDYSFVLDDNI